MNSTHLSATAETAARLRRDAGELEPYFSTTRMIRRCFPELEVTGRPVQPGLMNMMMRAMGHVILYKRELTPPEQRLQIAHALGHLIFDGDGRVASCTHVYEEELRAGRFAADLLVPLDELFPFVHRWPTENDESKGRDEIYLDQLDILASRFMVTQRLIDKRIREIRTAMAAGFSF